MFQLRPEKFPADLPAIPRLADVSPAYRQLLEKEQTLKKRQRELNQELQNFQQISKSSQRERVAALIEADGKLGSTPSRSIEHISQDIYDTQDAIEIIEGQIRTERLRASNKICSQLAPEYQRHVHEIFAAIIALDVACIKYDQFTSALNSENIAWLRLRPMYPRWLGRSADKSSNLARWVREALEYGFVTKAEIPEHLR